MKVEVVANPKKSESGLIELYATRFARKCLLERLCPPEHPVLTLEHRLIDEARQHLHEHLLKRSWNKIELETKIRRHASKKVVFLTEDSSVLKIVMADIWIKPLDDAFPDVN